MKFKYLVALFAFTLIIGSLGFSVKEGASAGIGATTPAQTAQTAQNAQAAQTASTIRAARAAQASYRNSNSNQRTQ